jgi:hypothetical protein
MSKHCSWSLSTKTYYRRPSKGTSAIGRQETVEIKQNQQHGGPSEPREEY